MIETNKLGLSEYSVVVHYPAHNPQAGFIAKMPLVLTPDQAASVQGIYHRSQAVEILDTLIAWHLSNRVVNSDGVVPHGAPDLGKEIPFNIDSLEIVLLRPQGRQS